MQSVSFLGACIMGVYSIRTHRKKMKSLRLITLSLLALLCSVSAFATDTIPITKAFQAGLIRVSIQGNGGYRGKCIRLSVQNKTVKRFILTVPPGQLFASKDTNVQDLVTTAPLAFQLSPRATQQMNISTMCTQSYNMGPSSGEAFSLGKMVEGHLLTLVNLIAKNNYQTSTAQSAVWSVANGDPVSSIYGTDTTMVRQVANVVSDATGTPITAFHIQPRRHQITSINTSLECYFKQKAPQTQLAVYDESGEMVRSYFRDQSFEAGFMQFKIGMHHTRGESTALFLRLTQGDSVLAERRITVNDTIPPMRKLNSQTRVTYKLEQNAYAHIGVYDDQDRLCLTLAGRKYIPRGYHRTTFIVGKELPMEAELFIKIKVGDEVINSTQIDVNSRPIPRNPRRFVSGTLRMKLDQQLETGKLAVYDAQGGMIRIFFENSKLYPGKKALDYSFRHFEGPDAILFLRLTDGNGTVIHEEQLDP